MRVSNEILKEGREGYNEGKRLLSLCVRASSRSCAPAIYSANGALRNFRHPSGEIPQWRFVSK